MSNEKKTKRMNGRIVALFVGLAILSLAMMTYAAEVFDQPPPPCHPNPNANQDQATLTARGDIVNLPQPLKDRLIRMARRPHTYLPLQIFAEADGASQLFQYYLLDTTGFEANVFTAIFPNINDQVQLTATGFDCGIPTVGAVRIALEPKPGLPTDPNDPRAFNDVFTDIHGLFVINNESGWYEGWMIHDLVVPQVAPPRSNGQAQFGMITQADADALLKMGTGNNIPGNIFTMDGNAVHFPSSTDRFADGVQTNVVPIQVSMGAYNCLQQSDCHAYWEFNYLGTNWVAPLYELPFTGGFSNKIGQPPDAFDKGQIGKLSSLVPGSGPKGKKNKPQDYGDNPNLSQTSISAGGPRDPDRFDGDVDAQREFRFRTIPSGLANEILLDVYVRVASFHASMKNLDERLNKAYAEEVARVDQNSDGVISAVEGDIDSASDGFADNSRLFLPPTVFNRFAVTREINDGYLSPRFAPSQRAWVLSGVRVPVNPTVNASEGRDGDDR